MERLTTRHNGVAVIKDKRKHKEAMEKLARYEETREWVPASERLPETSEPVLVFTDSHTQEIWSLIKDEDGDYWEDDYGYGQLIRDAIAWMPLPEPYRKDVE